MNILIPVINIFLKVEAHVSVECSLREDVAIET